MLGYGLIEQPLYVQIRESDKKIVAVIHAMLGYGLIEQPLYVQIRESDKKENLCIMLPCVILFTIYT